MNENADWFEWGFRSLMGVVGGAGVYLWSGLVAEVKDLRKQHEVSMSALQEQMNDNKTRLLEHKLVAEQTYAGKSEMQASLGRVHDRLDEMGQDIKTILGKVGNSRP